MKGAIQWWSDSRSAVQTCALSAAPWLQSKNDSLFGVNGGTSARHLTAARATKKPVAVTEQGYRRDAKDAEPRRLEAGPLKAPGIKTFVRLPKTSPPSLGDT